MSFWDSFRRGFVIGTLICFPFYLALFLFTQCSVGERAPSPSPGVPMATARADSEAAPARSLADGNGEDVVPVEEAELAARDSTTPQPEPASTVTQSALIGEGGMPMGDSVARPYLPSRPTVTVSPTDGGAYIAPATPVARARSVETLAPKSVNSYDPWPAYLWPVVECLIQRESGGLEWKVSPGGDVGLMQIGPANFIFLAERGITRAMLFDGPANIRAGWLLYVWWEGVNGDGLTPWKSTRGGCA